MSTIGFAEANKDLRSIQSLALGAKNADEIENGGLGRIGMTKDGVVYKFSTSAFGRAFTPTTQTMREDCDRLREHMRKLIGALLPSALSEDEKNRMLENICGGLGVSAGQVAKKPLLDRRVVAQTFKNLNGAIDSHNLAEEIKADRSKEKGGAYEPRKFTEGAYVSIGAEDIDGYFRHRPHLAKIMGLSGASEAAVQPKVTSQSIVKTGPGVGAKSKNGMEIELADLSGAGAPKSDKRATTERIDDTIAPKAPKVDEPEDVDEPDDVDGSEDVDESEDVVESEDVIRQIAKDLVKYLKNGANVYATFKRTDDIEEKNADLSVSDIDDKDVQDNAQKAVVEGLKQLSWLLDEKFPNDNYSIQALATFKLFSSGCEKLINDYMSSHNVHTNPLDSVNITKRFDRIMALSRVDDDVVVRVMNKLDNPFNYDFSVRVKPDGTYAWAS